MSLVQKFKQADPERQQKILDKLEKEIKGASA
jgi:hypothetical protein